MKPQILCLTAIFLLAATLVPVISGEKDPAEDRAAQAVMKWGGRITRDTDAEDKPVVVGVDLADTKVTDAGLKELKHFKSLQSLNLTSIRVTDAGLKELKDLTGLSVASYTSAFTG